jgi:hypothetical protein
VEREAITDSVLKIQSIQASLGHVDDAKIPGVDAIHNCLKMAHGTLRSLLRESVPRKRPRAKT